MTPTCGHGTLVTDGSCSTCNGLAALSTPAQASLRYGAIKDSGEREQFNTGAVRDTQEGKPRPDFVLEWLPLEAAERVACHYENGALKYSRDNWRKGIPASRCLASAYRHLYQWQHGDRSEDHLSAVVFNVLCILTWEQTNRADMLDVLPATAEKKEPK